MVSRVSSPAFIGRAEALARLEAAVDRAATSAATAVVVGGEAGVGKSRLVHELAARCSYARVLRGACIELGDSGPPFGPIVEVLRTLVREDGAPAIRAAAGPAADELGRLVPELAPAVAEERLEAHGAGRVFEVVLALFERLALERPLLIVVEDLHWADHSTRHVLSYLVHQLGPARVALVATFRSDEINRRHPLRPFLAEVERSGRVERIDLPRFDRDEVAALLEGILDADPPTALVDTVFTRAEGNAFFTEELVAAGADQPALDLPPSLRDVLLVRVERLSPPAQELLRIAAAAGRTVSDALLAAVAHRDDIELAEQLREAIEQQLIERVGDDGYGFRHALLQEALVGELLPGERVDVHADYARAISERPERVGGDRVNVTALLAHHWFAAQELEHALVASIDAALAAERVGAMPEARGHFDRALSLWTRAPGDRSELPLDHVELLRKLADADSLLGDNSRALQLVDRAIAETPTDDALRLSDLLVRKGRYLWRAGATSPALAAYAEARATCPADPPTAQRARTLSAYGQSLMLVSRYRDAEPVCREAMAVAQAVGDRETDGHARNTLGGVLGTMGRFDEGHTLLRESREIAFEVKNYDDVMRWYTNYSESLLRAGSSAEGLQVAKEGAALARQLGFNRVYGSYLHANIALINFALGDWDSVDRSTRTGLDLDAQGVSAIRVHALRARLLVARGDVEGARGHVDVAARLASHADDVQHGAIARGAEAEVLAVEGDAEGAIAVSRHVLDVVNASDDNYYAEFALTFAVSVAADVADAARARHDDAGVADARELAAPFLERADRLRHVYVSPRTRGELATIAAERARLDGADDAERWRATAAVWRELGEPYPEARARARLAEALLAAGGARPEAVAELRAAAAVAERLEAAPLLDHIGRIARWARVDLDRAAAPLSESVEAAPDEAPFALTPREREVLRMVADGCTNREIAAALFISVKTASVHVSNILAKLGVANRAEAGVVAHRLGLADS
ncbi:MAG TPA: AAA family ATPase [Acidimicrobiia bacterium]|nr:AAA family ATPase [Acidimicrobiia bacterium]